MGMMVVLVDEQDREIGLADKLEVHRSGALHRAVSVFLLDAGGRLLVQRRAREKYHSGGLWSNSACTHPGPGETPDEAARRCLDEELGLQAASLEKAFTFIYRAPVGPGMIEHELDHVFIGTYEGTPRPIPAEVSEWKLLEWSEVTAGITGHPMDWTPWCALLAGPVRRFVSLREGTRE